MVSERVGGAIYELDLSDEQFRARVRQSEQTFRAAAGRIERDGAGITRALGMSPTALAGMRQQAVAVGALSNAQVDAQRTSRGLSGDLLGMGRTAAVVAVGIGGLSLITAALSTALNGAVNAAAQDAASQAQLRTAVEATGASYAEYEDALDAVIKKGQERGFSDDQTRSSLAILTAQTDSAAEAQRRYAIAQDLSRGTGMDVVNASRLLGKVTEENVRALQRYGISVKDGATETEALAEVQKKFAGQADAFASSQAGQIARTTDALGEAGEALGRLVLPPVIALSGATEDAAHGTEAVVTQLDKVVDLGDVFGSLTTAALLFGGALVSIKAAQFVAEMQKAIAARIALERALSARSFALPAGANVAGTSTIGVAVSSIGKSLLTPQNAVIGLTAAYVGLDLAVRHFTGSGVISHLTGQAAAHRRAAAAARDQKEVVEDLERLSREGVTGDRAQALLAVEQIGEANRKLREYEAALLRARELNAASLRFAPGTDIPYQTAPVAPIPNFPSFDKEANKIKALELNYEQLNNVIAAAPQLARALSDEMERQARIAGPLAVSIVQWAAAIDKAKRAQASFTSSLSDLEGFATAIDPMTEALKLQKLELEQMKDALGDAFGEANQARLDELTRRIDLAERQQQILTQSVRSFAAQVREDYGSLAPDVIKNVNAALIEVEERLGRPEAIKLLVALPNLVQQANVFKRFIDSLRAGATVDVAVRVAAIGAFPQRETLTRLPGESQRDFTQRKREAEAERISTPVQDRGVSAEAQRIIDDWNRETDAFNKSAGAVTGDLGAISSGAGAAGDSLSYLDRVLQAVSDGTIDLAEAMMLGLSDAQVVTLELAAARATEEDAMYRQRIELMKLAALYPGLNGEQIRFQIGLAAIQRHLRESGQTIEQFLYDVNAGVLQGAQGMLQQMLGGPTRESLQLQLQLAQLEKRRLLILQGGGSEKEQERRLKPLDAEIEALRNAIALRDKEIEIMRIRAQLDDQQLQTDRTLINSYVFLTAVIRNFSTALNDSIAPLQSIAGIGTTLPSFASGIDYVPQPMIAKLHTGERVLTAVENRRYGEQGHDGPWAQFNATFHDTDDAKVRSDMNRQLNEALRRRRRGGYLTPGGAFRP